MQNLFDEFIRERQFIHNLSPRTIHYYKQVYRVFRDTGAFNNLSRAKLNESLIAFRQRGVGIGTMNTYIKGINAFLNWLHTDKNYEKLPLKKTD